MKKILLAGLIAVLFISCSNTISKAEAEKIIKDCIEEHPKHGKIYVWKGRNTFYKDSILHNERLDVLKKLGEEGYLKLDLEEQRDTCTIYNLTLNNKSKEYTLKSYEKTGWNIETDYEVLKTYDYEFVSIKEIWKVPKTKATLVTVVYKKVNKTPFFELSEDKTDFKTVKETIWESSYDYWKSCD
ncbi:hypothetical protein [Sinomicrobium weinanense]|uniref:Lipoprotein n=1 Tax=Sinomicrobium weinanense TaxID=2842200 RepID=A0A926JPU4_9FLAO|nr:hypothetical protein [Sinomicrobium weinanense]MBC9795119.1 hypothetical protein [Sinomicrobium weinanense]MBU3123749.1 hypothetical protein [Sinomicrobium weinanense]